MGLLDVTTNVLTLYRADTSDQKAKLKELSGIERQVAEDAIKAAEARNKATDSTIDKLGKLGLAFNTITQVARAAFGGLEEYGHKLDLQAAAGSVSIEKLGKAASGLKSEMELLSHAAVFNKSAFQLTEDQMATVERGMHALEERGKSGEEVWSAMSTVLTKGTTKALEGLIGPIQKSSDAFDVNGDVIQTYGARAKAVDAILKQLASTSKEAAEGEYDEADRIQSVTVRITDAMDHIKDSMGKMVVALEPLIRGVAKLAEVTGGLVNIVAEGYQNLGDIFALGYGDEKDRAEMLKRIGQRSGRDLGESAGSDRLENYQAQGGTTANFITAQLLQDLGKDPNSDKLSFSLTTDARYAGQRADMFGEQALALLLEGTDKMKKRYAEGTRAAAALREERKKLANEVAKLGGEELLKQLEDEQGGVSFTTFAMWHASERTFGATARGAGSSRWDSFVDDNRVTSVPGLAFSRDIGGSSENPLGRPLGGLPGARPGESDQLQQAMKDYYGDYFKTGSMTSQFGKMQADAYTKFNQKKNQSFLEQTFGKLEEFNVYKSAFDSLSSAVGAGFEAWITGSKSFAEAFRQALGKTLAAESISMALQALKATALGIFAVASYNYPQAALYFTSAAEFAAAAIAFGAGAAIMGVGGGGGGGGGSAGGGSGGSAGSAPNVTQTQERDRSTQAIVVIGDSFAEDSPRMRQIRAQRLVGLARGSKGVVYE
jgi:hypothetical protein